MQLDPASLSTGDHEFESLGFEDCCDGHAELEVHLNCDTTAAAWRVVTSGKSDCFVCTASTLAATCSAFAAGRAGGQGSYDFSQANTCGSTGNQGGAGCQASAGGCGSDASYFDGVGKDGLDLTTNRAYQTPDTVQ